MALHSEKLPLRRLDQETPAPAAKAQLHRELERGNLVRVFRVDGSARLEPKEVAEAA